MLAEVLLVLEGHGSSFFVPSPIDQPTRYIISPSLRNHLHPGEISSLEVLGSLAFKYRRIKTWAEDVQRRGRQAVLASTLLIAGASGRGKVKGKGKQTQKEDENAPNQYLSVLASSILDILSGYDLLIVELEAKILEGEYDSLVQDQDQKQNQQCYIPLSSLVATFDKWQSALSSLFYLIDQLSSSSRQSTSKSHAGQDKGDEIEMERTEWTPGEMIDLIQDKTYTGDPFLSKIYSTLFSSLRHLFLTHLVTFTLYGLASTPSSVGLGIDAGVDPISPRHRVYTLNKDLLPRSIKGKTRESILYIGRVAATLKREGRSLPKPLIEGLRKELMGVDELEEELDDAISRSRAEVGEWLWKHILTGPQIAETIESFANLFLLRKTDYAISTLRELTRLRMDKLILANPHSSSSVIREQDLDLALLRASVGTSAEMDRSLEVLHFNMDDGPLRALLPASLTTAKKQHASDTAIGGSGGAIKNLFSAMVLGTPIRLMTHISWPMDLFMTPQSISTYSEIHSYLFAIRDTHLRVLDSWTSLSSSQRQRRKWTGVNEGGISKSEIDKRKKLGRMSWGVIRAMLFFIDQLLAHFMLDIIDVQHRRLLDSLDLIERDNPLQNLTGSISSTRGLGIGAGSTRPNSPIISSIHRTPTPATYAPSTMTMTDRDRDRQPLSPYSDTHTHTHTQGDAQTLRSNKAPPTPSKSHTTYLDFLTLRQMHARHLSFLKQGLLLDPSLGLTTIIRDILEGCKRFTGLVERWGGDVIPELLVSQDQDGDDVVEERLKEVCQVSENLHEQLLDFFGALLDTQNPQSSSLDPNSDKSAAAAEGQSSSRGTNASRLAISKMVSRHSTFGFIGKTKSRIASTTGNISKSKSKLTSDTEREKEERGLEVEAIMSGHVEQLLLRLDFNGVLTSWRSKEDHETVPTSLLAEGGLS